MFIDNPTFNLFNLGSVIVLFKIGYIIFAILYFFFSLIVVRQVALMTETVVTEAGGILKVLSIIYAIFSLGIVVLFFLML